MVTFRVILQGLIALSGIFVMILMVYQLGLSAFGFGRRRKLYEDHEPQCRFLVLVPAHNEEAVVADIVENLQHMEYPKELYDFFIIADNCSDRTADVARQMGANVLELHKERADDPTGKPLALQKALNLLTGYQDRYDMLMIFDADNLIDPNMFLEVGSQYISENRPEFIQCYLGSKTKKGLVAWFYYTSYTITNRFFQLAKSRLGLNCTIGGTGFAVDTNYLYDRGGWTALSLTEDFEIQVEATLAGKRILWNHNVRVYDEKPTRLKASYRQRTRWAQGHWFVTLRNTKRLFKAVWKKQMTFKEGVSLFTYMYSLASSLIVVGQMVAGWLLKWVNSMIKSDEAMDAVAQTTAQLADGGWISTAISIALFSYSFFLLFYVADWMDNRVALDVRTVPKMLLSFLVNMALATCSQLVGLVRFRHQNNWVKTEHKIRRLDRSGREARLPARARRLTNSASETVEAKIVEAQAK